MLQVRTITGEECVSTRDLWEEVFSEDTHRFLDYYYSRKAERNIGYVIGEKPYAAMMFRTPYNLQVNGAQREISYLVAVATRKEFRHKGYMTALLMKSFREMYTQKNPFTFLMPANPAIYEPFDFSYIYEREIFKIEEEWVQILEVLWEEKEELVAAGSDNEGKIQSETLNLRVLERWEKESGCRLYSLRKLFAAQDPSRILNKAAQFANLWLAERYEIYAIRDEEYYHRQLLELLAQKGDIFMAEKNGQIEGLFFYAREEEDVSIQELMEKKEGLFSFLIREEKRKPVIMARIIHLEEMLRLARSEKRKTVLMEVEDPLLFWNNGTYRVEMTPRGSTVERLSEYREAKEHWHIKDLTPVLLKNVFLNEIV